MGTDRKISDLASLTGANAADGDLLHIVDISEAATVDQNKSITTSELAKKLVTINVGLTAYTPVFSAGFGTTTNVQFHYVILNGIMNIFGRFTAGTTTTALAEIGLPSGYQIHSSLTAYVHLGNAQMQTVTTVRDGIIAVAGATHFGLSRLDAGSDALAIMQTSLGVVTGWTMSFSFQVPVEAV